MLNNGKKIRGRKLRRREEGTLFFLLTSLSVVPWNKPITCVISASELKKLTLHDVINNYY